MILKAIVPFPEKGIVISMTETTAFQSVSVRFSERPLGPLLRGVLRADVTPGGTPSAVLPSLL